MSLMVSDMVINVFSHAIGILNVFTCAMWTFLFFKYQVDDRWDIFAKLVLLALSTLSVLVLLIPMFT